MTTSCANVLVLLWGLAACSDGGTPAPPGSIGTLADVLTQCREGAGAGSLRQELQILRREQPPVTAMAVGPVELSPLSVECRTNGLNRYGPGFVLNGAFAQDRASGSVLFYSSCDPFGTNPNGGQIFAMTADGSGLRQLTTTKGFTQDADGMVHTEIPSHWAYAP